MKKMKMFYETPDILELKLELYHAAAQSEEGSMAVPGDTADGDD